MIHEAAIIDLDGDVLLSPKSTHQIQCHHQKLGIRQKRITTEHIDVELPVLAQASALRTLIAPEIGDAKPTHRTRELIDLASHHTSQCRGHLRAYSDLALAPVDHPIELLIDDLLACLSGV